MLSKFCFLVDYPCFWLFFLSVLAYFFPSWTSVYCLPTYLTLLVSIYIIALVSKVCKPPGLLSFVNFINVLFTSFSRSLIEILNKDRPKTYCYSKPAQYVTSHHYLLLTVLRPPFLSRSHESASSPFQLDFSKRVISVVKVFYRIQLHDLFSFSFTAQVRLMLLPCVSIDSNNELDSDMGREMAAFGWLTWNAKLSLVFISFFYLCTLKLS